VVNGKRLIAVLALLASGLMCSSQQASAHDFGHGVFARNIAHSLSRNRPTGWIRLHRPDGEVVHVNADQIVFVSNSKNTGGNARARSRLQLVNGFSDVLETVDEVMQSIKNDDPLEAATDTVDDILSKVDAN
jgi:hypothetical protein